MLNLCVSDLNKSLLLNADGFIPLLLDSLLLDPKHPRRSDANTDFDAVCGPVQRDYAEAIAQLSMFPPGREALLRDPAVMPALQQVAAEGFEEQARQHAQSALVALADRQPDVHRTELDEDLRHVMVSYQWNVQAVVQRIVSELQHRGYRTWFDLDNMKGSTVDAMSDAIDSAEVMLGCISLAYKESANCRLEMQYCHQQDVEMIPLVRLLLAVALRPSCATAHRSMCR